MATYIANKPCRFGGKSYLIGDKIPDDAILPRRVGSLLRMGVLVEGADETAPVPTPPAKPKKTIPVQQKEETTEKPEK